jgi:iron complex transport system substrate-binding protein
MVDRHDALRDTIVVSQQPLSLDDVFDDIRRLGEVTACMTAADRYLGHLRGRVEAVRERTDGLSLAQRPRVAVIEWTDPLMAAGNWTAELVHLAGGCYGVGQQGQHSRYARWEAFCDFDPQVLIVSPCGFALERSALEASRLCQLPGWADIAAVRSGRAYVVDGNAYLNRPGPRLVDSLEILAHMIHPKLIDSQTLVPPAGSAWCCIGHLGATEKPTSLLVRSEAPADG